MIRSLCGQLERLMLWSSEDSLFCGLHLGGGTYAKRDAEINTALRTADCFTIAKEVMQELCPRLDEWTSQTLALVEVLKKYLETEKITTEYKKLARIW